MTEQSRSSIPKIWKSPPQPSFRRSFVLDTDDHLRIQFSTRQMLPFWPFVLSIGGVALFVALVSNYAKLEEGQIAGFVIYVGSSVVACMLLASAAVRPLRRLWRFLYQRSLLRHGAAGAPMESIIDQNGIFIDLEGRTTACTWDSLYALEADEDAFYFWLTHLSAHPWPARLFSSQNERDEFQRKVEEWSGRAFHPPALARMGAIGRNNLPEWQIKQKLP